MAINNMTTAASALKLHYAKEMAESVFKDNPTLERLPKELNWGGTSNIVPIKFTLGDGGGSADFTSGSANSVSTDYVHWIVTSTKVYHFSSVDGELLNASKIAPDAFMDASKEAISNGLQAMANATSIALFRNGKGVRGRIVTSPAIASSATTISLANPRDAKNFEKGMVILGSTLSDGTALKLTGRTISAVNRSSGTLSFSSAVDGGEAWAAGDYLYRAGDGAAVLTGFDGWLPETVATSGDSFFSVNRAQDRERLAGIFYDGSAQSLAEGLIDGLASGIDLGAEPDTVIVSSQTFANLAKELGSQAFQQNFSKGEVGFQKLMVHTPRGPVELVGDRSCPDGVAYALNIKSWYIASRGPKLFNIDDRDGLMARLNTTSDRLDFRFYSYLQLICKNPIKNIRIKLPTS